MRKRVSWLVVVGVGALMGGVSSGWAQTPAATAPAGGDMAFRSIFAGAAITCGLNAAGEAFCWGDGGFGQLGAVAPDTCRYKEEGKKAAVPCAMKPLPVQGGLHFVSLALGNLHGCGLTGEGVAYCWGDNSFGQLGVDSVSERCREGDMSLPCTHAPVAVSGGLHFKQLAAGRFLSCGLATDGVVRCWGQNGYGQLGTGDPLPNCTMDQPGLRPTPCSRKPVPVVGDLKATAIATGQGHNCALGADSAVVCWGVSFAAAPKPIPGDHRFVRLLAGGMTTCAVGADDVPWCWGLAKRFARGRMEMSSGNTPEKGGTWVSDQKDPRFPVLAVGGEHICGLNAAGRAFCWGRVEEGQLGVKRPAWKRLMQMNMPNDPVAVEGDLVFVALAAGSAHSCGVTADGRTYCWGANLVGQLGDGTTESRDTPVPVLTGPAAMARAGTQP